MKTGFVDLGIMCAAHGGSAWDHSALVRALEKMANFHIGRQATVAP